MPNNNKNRTEARKNKAHRSWEKRQKEKAANVAENEKRRKANAAARAAGQETAYQKSQRERREARAEKSG